MLTKYKIERIKALAKMLLQEAAELESTLKPVSSRVARKGFEKNLAKRWKGNLKQSA